MKKTLGHLVAGLGWLAVAFAANGAELQAVTGWVQRVELGPLVSGVVSEVHVRPGDRVDKGARLVTLDRRDFASRVTRREAERRHAELLLEEAQREDERAAELYDRTLLSDHERNQAAIALEAARAAAETARAALSRARLDLERSQLRAPFDALVVAVAAVPGQSVVSELQSQALVTLADRSVVVARAAVDAEQAAALASGQVLRATLRGQSVEVRVREVGLEPLAAGSGPPAYALVVELPAADDGVARAGESLLLHLE
jgi:multidrug efflux system membrane fusion protein